MHRILFLRCTHEAHCERFKSKKSLVQASPPEDHSGLGRSVDVTKLTGSLRGDSAPTSAHQRLEKQNRLKDVQEDLRHDKYCLLIRSGSAINCIPLPSPGRNTTELGMFVQDPCTERSMEVAQAGGRGR